MGDMIYLAAGYAVFLIVTFVLVFSMISRQRKLQQELVMLEQLSQDDREIK